MKKLVIYYSFEGNTKLMAETMAETIQADVLGLKPANEPKSKGFMKYLWGGKEALMRSKPDLLPLDKNPQDYDILFIGTPVWAWTYAPPLNSFFSMQTLSHKKIALFCCHGGGKGKIFNKMKKALAGNEFLGEIDFLEPLKKDTDTHIQSAKKWAEKIMEGLLGTSTKE